MQKLASLATVAGATSPTGNFLLKDKWVILTTTGVYTYKFATGEMAADPRLNIKKGELGWQSKDKQAESLLLLKVLRSNFLGNYRKPTHDIPKSLHVHGFY